MYYVGKEEIIMYYILCMLLCITYEKKRHFKFYSTQINNNDELSYLGFYLMFILMF